MPFRVDDELWFPDNGDASNTTKQIDLGDDFGAVVVKANGARVTIGADGSIDGLPAAANDSASKAAHEIGDIESAGEHKGEIYGGIFPGDNKPIWILEEPKPMTHDDTAELKGRALPTSEQGKYIDAIKGKGALGDIFARHSDGSSPTGYFRLADQDNGDTGYQRFSDGSQRYRDLNFLFHLTVLSVRR